VRPGQPVTLQCRVNDDGGVGDAFPPNTMKKTIESEVIRPVDFSGGVRGKHCAAYRRSHTVKVQQDDGTITVQKFVPDSDAVLIDRDVRDYFPDAASINNALRAIIGIMPQKYRKMSTVN